ncbi:echinoderm microtubule-associated protein-like 2 isoform X2 [Nematostella vectensis]|uniref:echinoderm microtubule-associated protein-like 2 isoform X2 n=1 Tax=Nematostella vectensis TaxID=45351 RepID=UPI002076D963|nr:echinoderm microtubule-associated protein-like 2 isoform X2 [Nematostella vectensis]
MMYTPKYDYKIICGKLRRVPVRDKHGEGLQTYPRDRFESGVTPIKIGSRYSTIPPITAASGYPSARPSDEVLVDRIQPLISRVPRARLTRVREGFKHHDYQKDGSGRATTDELRHVLNANSIFILDPTLSHLVDKFKSELGGVRYNDLCDFLEECYDSYSQRHSKLGVFSSQSFNTPLYTKPVSVSRPPRDDSLLKLELEHELKRAAEEGLFADLKNLKSSFENSRDRENLPYREAIRLCPPDRLPITLDLLEKALSVHRIEGSAKTDWRSFIELLEPIVNKVMSSRGNTNQRSSNIQTQTNADPDPVFIKLRGRRIPVYPPDNAQPNTNPDKPDQRLALEWVYGYRGKDCRNNLVVVNETGELAYFTAAIVVLYNLKKHTQRHYTQHTDDVKSLAVHPDGRTIASGQVAGHEEVQGEPHFRIWDVVRLETIAVIGLGHFGRAVNSLAFSKKDHGRYIVSVDDDDYHTITVWDWERNKIVASARGHMDQVLVASFTPFEVNEGVLSLVSCGKQHVSFWNIEEGRLKCDRGRFDHHVKPLYISCLTFARNGDVITGDTNGTIYVWREGTNEISSSITNAHQGPVYALLVLPNGDLLSGGGKDGTVRAWNNMKELSPTGVELRLHEYGVTGIRTLAFDDSNTLYIGTTDNCIWSAVLSLSKSPLANADKKQLISGHSGSLQGLAAHPSEPKFFTAGSDMTVRVWNSADHSVQLFRPPADNRDKKLIPCAVSVSSTADTIAVGYKDGSFGIFNVKSGEPIFFKKRCAQEKISDLKYSPDVKCLAVASHDNNIYVYTLENGGKSMELCGKCEGHTSYVTHFDWSVGSDFIQSTSGDYELLFWDAKKCEQIKLAKDMRNTEWATQNCVLGYPVLGIWPKKADGTDINSVDRSHSRTLLATGDDFGDVNLFRYMCDDRKAEPRVAKGHSAHVTCVRFLADDTRLISVGGRDASILQWRIV